MEYTITHNEDICIPYFLYKDILFILYYGLCNKFTKCI